MTQTTHLALPFIDAAQAQKHVTHNEALQLLDAVTQLSVIARNQSAPPASPAEGDRYLVGAAATGAFAGKDGEVAAWLAGAWTFFAPRAGWLVYVAGEQMSLVYDGAGWLDAGLALRALQGLELLGIGTTADAVNRLAAKLNAALFAAKTIAEGGDGDLRVKLEKEGAGNTASQLYQTNWSGRAETGLLGDDSFHVKVSADGSSWKEAINVDNSTGHVSFPSGVGDGSLAGFRNRLRNASFAINQRGVSGTVALAAGAYGHDGVKAGASGATYSFSVAGLDTTITISAGSLILPIEASLVEGGAYTLSHAGTAQARIWQGTGYTGSGAYAACPIVLTSLSANTQTNVEFSTGTMLRPQLEPGLYATSFERRPLEIEMTLCLRYGRVLTDRSESFGVAYMSTNVTFVFPQTIPMRADPTVSLLGAGSWWCSDEYAGDHQATSVSIAASNMSAKGGRLSLTGFSSLPNPRAVSVSGSVGTAKILLSAEI